MRHSAASKNETQGPRRWPIVALALCLLSLCSCRGTATPGMASNTAAGLAPGSSPALPPEAFAAMPQGPPGMEQGVPLPYTVTGPWAPPGLAQPWPQDEYLADGGDKAPAAQVMPNREVRGLNFEDTVAHYDTLDGRTLVEPSNRVQVYSPRFRAVRQVVNIQQNEQAEGVNDVHLPTRLAGQQRTTGPDMSTQRLQPQRQITESGPITYRSRQGDGAVSSAVGLRKFHNSFQVYEDCSAIRHGIILEAEMAFLAEGTQAAITWSDRKVVEVVLDSQTAVATQGTDKLSLVYGVKEKPHLPKLRVIKVASTQFAQPGETVDFTLRFDNIGNEPIGNVTLLDNLTTRLEYVPDSSQSSVPTEFSWAPNEAGSQVLRWVVTKPLGPGEGGIVRFRCRVR